MTPCRNGSHTLVEILRAPDGDADKVARWCAFCGAVVVDLEFDNRVRVGGVSRMRFPEVIKPRGT